SVLEQLLTARMSFPNSSRIPLGQANQPPKPQALIPSPCCPQVMHFLGQYIMARQLYDQRQQHLVHCGGDQLGELLGLQSFSVKDPSCRLKPFFLFKKWEMWHKIPHLWIKSILSVKIWHKIPYFNLMYSCR
uniref:Uncharacterized protein n=1 Tax=Junco hyemalis TaxID=40217 RepID=A0A8C5NIP7_JUNHY